MFTIEQIHAAHAKVKTGADYPRYVQDLIRLGISSYETFVKDGNTTYQGKNGHTIQSGLKYPFLYIADKINKDRFLKDIKAHQEGKSDFPTFCRQCAESGIEKWVVDLAKMTCTYYDKAEIKILVEEIPV